MEARKRWVILSTGMNPEATYLPDREPNNCPGMMWTGREQYPMWTREVRNAQTFATKDEADSAALLFAVRRPEWFGCLVVHGYMDMDEQ